MSCRELINEFFEGTQNENEDENDSGHEGGGEGAAPEEMTAATYIAPEGRR